MAPYFPAEATVIPTIVPGTIFHARYRVERCIKAGGMGAVYDVVDAKTQRHRALKVMLPSLVTDKDMRARFKLEATITAPIESEHIAQTFDADIDEETGSPFLVMELLRGEDLGAVLNHRGPFEPEEVVRALGQVALALDRAHAAGVVHRDLKPENLFMTERDDGSPRIVVLDFGIAKIVADSSEAAGTTCSLGTPAYMSPEQIRGDRSIGPRSDIYALGHVAFTLLVGAAYWSEEQAAAPALYAMMSTILRGIEEPASVRARRMLPRSTLPPAFDAWFATAAATDPELRFDRCSILVTALAEAFSIATPGREGSGLRPSAAARPERRSEGQRRDHAAPVARRPPTNDAFDPTQVSAVLPEEKPLSSTPRKTESRAPAAAFISSRRPLRGPGRSSRHWAIGALGITAAAALGFLSLRSDVGSLASQPAATGAASLASDTKHGAAAATTVQTSPASGTDSAIAATDAGITPASSAEAAPGTALPSAVLSTQTKAPPGATATTVQKKPPSVKHENDILDTR